MNSHSSQFFGCVLLALAVSPTWGSPAPQVSSDEEIKLHIQAARTAERGGDWTTAIREYNRLTQLLPKVAEIQNNLGIDYYQAHRPQQALTALQRAHTLDPSLASPVLFSGLALYQLGRYKEAASTLEQTYHQNPRDALARTWLVYSLLVLDRYDEALQILPPALELEPNNVDLLYVLYRVHVELGQRDTRALIGEAPNSARVWQLAADQWQLLGDKEKAAALYREARSRLADLESHRNTPDDILFWRAEGHEKEAQEAAEKVVSLQPNSAQAYQISAETLRAQGRFDEAIQSYRKAVQVKPDLPEIHMVIGDLLLRVNRAEEALREYDLELKIWPNEDSVYFHKGLAYMMLDQQDQAFSAFMVARRSEIEIPELHAQLGKLLLRQHRFTAATVELRQYISKQPTDPQGHFLLMMAYRGLGSVALMNAEKRHFEKYSTDRKQRSLAERELGGFESAAQAAVPDDTTVGK